MIPADQETISRVISRYPVGPLERAEKAEGGMTNENWIVDITTGRYFLRRRNPMFGQISIDFELDLIDHLVQMGFPTASLIRNRAGERSMEIGGGHWELYDFIPGERFDPTDIGEVESAAALLARFHKDASGLEAGASKIEERKISPKRIDDLIDGFLVELKSREGIVGRALSPFIARMLRAEASRIWDCIISIEGEPRVLIHGDFQPSNVIFQRGRAAALIDFGDASAFYRVYDLARALFRFSATRPGYRGQADLLPRLDMRRFGAFARAYQRAEEPLTPGEKSIMPSLIRAMYIYDLVFFMGKERRGIRYIAWLIHAARFISWLEEHTGDLLKALDQDNHLSS